MATSTSASGRTRAHPMRRTRRWTVPDSPSRCWWMRLPNCYRFSSLSNGPATKRLDADSSASDESFPRPSRVGVGVGRSVRRLVRSLDVGVRYVRPTVGGTDRRRQRHRLPLAPAAGSLGHHARREAGRLEKGASRERLSTSLRDVGPVASLDTSRLSHSAVGGRLHRNAGGADGSYAWLS